MSNEPESGNSLAERELWLRKEIENYYLPKQLVDAIFEAGGIPEDSTEAFMGIGFIDVADYTYLSKFLSPKENQVVLNGLYTAFNTVLKRHGGYLNKIEGDSLMFHYGGPIDPVVKNMSEEEALQFISRELFYSCIEMQRVCVLFNQANDKFLIESADRQTRDVLRQAFDIISKLRNDFFPSSAVNALFQIRVRIGANIGEVTIGNFGPDEAKQWDIVGLPVIDAKRMESTAPIGGLRISETFYNVLKENGIVDAYYKRFRREAQALFGYYKTITQNELFKASTVILKDKKNVEFKTYSIEVNPGLPESITEQIELLLGQGEHGSDRILQLIQYYRGNKFVVSAIEQLFKRIGVVLRKDQIIKIMYPKKYDDIVKKFDNNQVKIAEKINAEYSLFVLLDTLGQYQDIVKSEVVYDFDQNDFSDYDQYMSREAEIIYNQYQLKKKAAIQRTYFYNVVYPLVFRSIRTSILEYQNKEANLESVDEDNLSAG